MMIGNNDILLNEATMQAAVQHWFETVMFAADRAPKVTGVTRETSNYESAFRIKVTDREPKKVEKPC
jgi:hypothetical protein